MFEIDEGLLQFLSEFQKIDVAKYPVKNIPRNNVELLPLELWKNTRKNIEKICTQINQSYKYEIYDGAMVLIRKLIEMLLILDFKHINEEDRIKDLNQNYFQLSDIINVAKNNTTIDLTRNAKEHLELFRDNGNFSAHNPFYTAMKDDFGRNQSKLRQLIQELFFKAGIIT